MCLLEKLIRDPICKSRYWEIYYVKLKKSPHSTIVLCDHKILSWYKFFIAENIRKILIRHTRPHPSWLHISVVRHFLRVSPEPYHSSAFSGFSQICFKKGFFPGSLCTTPHHTYNNAQFVHFYLRLFHKK